MFYEMQIRDFVVTVRGGKMPTHWSECSLEGMEDSFHQGLDYCLHNLPASLYSGPVCGNSFLEEGEECDCGLPEVGSHEGISYQVFYSFVIFRIHC